MAINTHDPVLMHLLEDRSLTEAQAEQVLEEHERTGRDTRRIVLESEFMEPDRMLEEAALYLSTSVASLNQFSFTQELLKSIPASTARMYNVVPVESTPTSVMLATYEFVAPETMDELVFVLGKDVTFVVVPEADLRSKIDESYGDDSDSVGDMLAALEGELEDAGTLRDKAGSEDINTEEMANLAPVIRFVNLVMYQGVMSRASDIHFEPFETDFKIRYRVDGALYEMSPPPLHLALPIISRVKVMSGLDITERRLPQDGRIQRSIGGKSVDFRVSTLPTAHGESVVLRVLDQSNVGLELENLGMPDAIMQSFQDDVRKPNGIVIVTGPTGSGKTTTLYSALKRIN